MLGENVEWIMTTCFVKPQNHVMMSRKIMKSQNRFCSQCRGWYHSFGIKAIHSATLSRIIPLLLWVLPFLSLQTKNHQCLCGAIRLHYNLTSLIPRLPTVFRWPQDLRESETRGSEREKKGRVDQIAFIARTSYCLVKLGDKVCIIIVTNVPPKWKNDTRLPFGFKVT